MTGATDRDYDVVIAGGGPAGSTTATLLAKQGARVLLLEKARFPRYQIGESLLPSTVHGICRLLGVSEDLERAAFPVKRGGTFRWGRNADPWTFAFGLHPRFAGSGATAYQVERMRFDDILLRHARRCGVEVREEHSVKSVVEDGDRVVGAVVAGPGDRRTEVRARWLVDASGHGSRIHQAVGGRRVMSEFFRNVAVFGYWDGGRRLPPPNEGNILAVAFEGGWFWYIPLADDLTSVGAVVSADSEEVRRDPEQALNALIERCDLVADNLAGARRITSGPYGRVRVRTDYSYSKPAFWRPGMVLVGDAACFIDPVFSSGVHLATYGALLAARSISTALTGRLPETDVFAEFEARYRREYGVFHDFLVGFYDLHHDEDSYFWQARKLVGDTASDLESFLEIVGGGASRDGALGAGGEGDRRPLERHELDDAVSGAGAAADGGNVSLLSTSLARAVLREGAGLQVQASVGHARDQRTPIRPGGLVPSEDGLGWVRPGGDGDVSRDGS